MFEHQGSKAPGFYSDFCSSGTWEPEELQAMGYSYREKAGVKKMTPEFERVKSALKGGNVVTWLWIAACFHHRAFHRAVGRNRYLSTGTKVGIRIKSCLQADRCFKGFSAMGHLSRGLAPVNLNLTISDVRERNAKHVPGEKYGEKTR